MITTAQIMGWVASNTCAQVPVEFVWSGDDPWAVRVNFTNAAWVFGLELLSAGLREPSGEGDVILWPAVDHTTLLMYLRAPTGQAVIGLPYGQVARFVDRAEQYAGQIMPESIDRQLAKILDGA